MTAPLVTNVRAADSRNPSVSKRASLWFLPAGLVGEANWGEFGNLIDPALNPIVKYLEHFTNRRGARTRDRIEISEVSAEMKFKIDEVSVINLQKLFGSSVAKASSTTTLRDGAVYNNPGNAGVITLPAGSLASVIVRSTNQEGAVTTYVAGGTDYTVDLTAGTVTINAGALTDAVAVPEIHIQWSKSVATEKFQMFDGNTIKGSAQFVVLTKSGLRVAATFNSVVITNDGDIAFGDGSKWIETGIKMECLADNTGSLGDVHVINAAATF